MARGAQQPEANKAVKVAIVGGGIAGLTAAFELTRPDRPGQSRLTYEVTVYQMGWRLGGKGASGRGINDRIEEHGLHVWMGFYENAFRLLRECYGELDKNNPNAWLDAFIPDSHVGVADKSTGKWESWTGFFPPAPGLPGDPIEDRKNPFTLQSYLARAVGLVRALILSVQTDLAAKGGAEADARSDVDELLASGRLEFSKLSPGLLVERMARMLRVGVLTSAAGLLQAMLLIEKFLRAQPVPPAATYGVLEFIEAVATNTRRQLQDVVGLDHRLRRKTEIIDLVMTIVVGALRDNLLTDPRGLDAINDMDCVKWLLKHGATRSAVKSPLVRGLYDMAFTEIPVDALKPEQGARRGRRPKQGLAAGQALRGALRMFFTYRGALFWRMRGGMGEVVFAPLYHVLKQRGVQFEFFHRLEKVEIGGNKSGPTYVKALQFTQQARVKEGYPFLKQVNGTYCWPSRAEYEYLENGKVASDEGWDFESFWDHRSLLPSEKRTVRKTLIDEKHNGRDFDFVVLAVGVGIIPHVCGELIDRERRWKAMVDSVKTVATQAFQLWMSEDMTKLGWTQPPVTLSAFAKPFDTWADMTHVVPLETWPSGRRSPPRAVAYFCGALRGEQIPDPELAPKIGEQDLAHVTARTEEVRRRAMRFVDEKLPHLWRGCGRPGSFDWSLLIDPDHPEEPVFPENAKPKADAPTVASSDAAASTSAQLTGERVREIQNEIAALGAKRSNLQEEMRNRTPRPTPARLREIKRLILTLDADIARVALPLKQPALNGQYVAANINPSDRYTLALPGTLIHRISPLDPTVDNMTIAGDWTDCGFNEGCVEAAVMSGRLAAHALSRSPALDEIIGYDHP
jgi:uncharacterized protein with NAD-binding domain and iron-sulfur cluster